jgi:hypothetical protein
LTREAWHVRHRDCVNSVGTHQMTGELVAYRSLLAGTYSLDDRGSAERPLGNVPLIIGRMHSVFDRDGASVAGDLGSDLGGRRLIVLGCWLIA